MKKCQQCGILKNEEDYRRSYYTSKKGQTESRYRICKNCESINARYRTLASMLEKDDYKDEVLKAKHQEELSQITMLYEELKRRGHQVPHIGAKKEDTLTPAQKALEQVMCQPIEDIITTTNVVANDEIIITVDKSETPVVINTPIAHQPVELPEDLTYWFGDEWLESNFDPEYLHEVVYESLKAKYRPLLSIDLVKHEPVYDNTYKDTLDEILKRFDDYEDNFDTKEDD